MVLEINDTNFEEKVLAETKLVVVDCGAEWCGPCKRVAPIIDELAEEYEGKAVIGKCDVDQAPSIPAKFGIRNVPTVLFIKNGQLLDRMVGANPKNAYKDKIEELL